MEKLNLWPDLDTDESTKAIFGFVRLLKDELKKNYDGKIDCSLEEVVYREFGMNAMMNRFDDIRKAMGPIEGQTASEIDKEEVCINPPKEYKFMIFNENYFFRVFDIKMGEYFPVDIRPAEGISSKAKKDYYEIDNESSFKQEVLSFLHSKYIKDIIRYMLEIRSV